MTPGGRARLRHPKAVRRTSNQRAAGLKVPPGVYAGPSLAQMHPGIRASAQALGSARPLDAPATVDDVNLPRGIARRSEVHDQIRDFLRLPEAPDRLARDEGRPGLVVVTLSPQAAFERRSLH